MGFSRDHKSGYHRVFNGVLCPRDAIFGGRKMPRFDETCLSGNFLTGAVHINFRPGLSMFSCFL